MHQEILIPTNCPTCNSILKVVSMQLFCVNLECPAVLDKNLLHFISTIGIKGIGAKTLPKLNFKSITDIYSATEEDLIEDTSSEKIGTKIYQQIQASKNAELHKVIASFGIPLVGKSAGEKLVKVIKSIDDITYEKCKEAGLGDKVTANLLEFLENDFLELRPGLPFSFIVEEGLISKEVGELICITGKLSSFKTKAEAKKVLQKLGYVVVESVTKSISYLVDETSNTSSKRAKAESYGLTIITNLSEFINKEENK
jgi:DNA ligase (NAD+)